MSTEGATGYPWRQALVGRLKQAFVDSVASPWICRRARSLVLDAGFTDAAVEVQTLLFTSYSDIAPALTAMAGAGVVGGTVGQDEAQAWLADQRRRDDCRRFFLAVPHFLVFARQPSDNARP